MPINLLSRSKQICSQTSAGLFSLGSNFDDYQSIEEGVADSTGGNLQGEQFEGIIMYSDQSYSTSWTRCILEVDGSSLTRVSTLRTKEQGQPASITDLDFDSSKDLIVYGSAGEALKQISALETSVASLQSDVDLINAKTPCSVSAVLAGSESISAGVPLVLTNFTSTINEGASFASGVFTAPDDNDFLIDCDATFAVTADQDRCRVYIYVDGSISRTFYGNGSGTAFLTLTGRLKIPLTAGQTLSMAVENVDSIDTIQGAYISISRA